MVDNDDTKKKPETGPKTPDSGKSTAARFFDDSHLCPYGIDMRYAAAAAEPPISFQDRLYSKPVFGMFALGISVLDTTKLLTAGATTDRARLLDKSIVRGSRFPPISGLHDYTPFLQPVHKPADPIQRSLGIRLCTADDLQLIEVAEQDQKRVLTADDYKLVVGVRGFLPDGTPITEDDEGLCAVLDYGTNESRVLTLGLWKPGQVLDCNPRLADIADKMLPPDP